MILLALFGVYLLYQLITLMVQLNSETNVDRVGNGLKEAKNIHKYMAKESNFSTLANHKIWDLPEYEKPQENNTTTQTKNFFELRDSNGFYTIIIGKKELDYLGVAKQGNQKFVILFDATQKGDKKIQHYYEGESIIEGIKLHKIEKSFVLLIETQTHKKLKIPYFFINEDEFKPKDHNES